MGGERRATDSAPARSRPRRPSESVLYRCVQAHLETWLVQCRDGHDDAGPVPAYVERATPGRCVPTAAGTRCELRDARESPASAASPSPAVTPHHPSFPSGPGRSRSATLPPTTRQCVGFPIRLNHRRLLEPIGNMPPAELEASYYQSTGHLPMAA
jgi:hypothetical protein